MKFSNFLKDKILSISLLIFAMITIEILLLCYHVQIFMKIYIPTIILSVYTISILVEYQTKQKYYHEIEQILKGLEDKYLLTEIMKNANFTEGKILKDILEQTDKSMLEHVNMYKYLQEDYKEYIEMWIHEIKLPIATSKMIIENNKTKVTKSIDEELSKIENYVEQALFYARSSTVEKDYYIKKCLLKDIIHEIISKNKSIFIREKITISTHDLDLQVLTDSKWLVFIVEQILQNSIKYRKKEDGAEIEIFSKLGKENVILYVKDNGIGIPKGEVGRVFDKGFTGTNGRISNKKSTGIGLYLCKKLCDKLGMGIEITSDKDVGTEVRFIFPNNTYFAMVK